MKLETCDVTDDVKLETCLWFMCYMLGHSALVKN